MGPGAAANVPPEQLVAAWSPFTANAGTYEVSNTMLTTRALVAKNPAVMSPKTFTEFSVKMEGQTLALTTVRNAQGPVQNPQTWRLTRIE